MSFIGSGELEHKITQLQRQLDHKDHELNSMRNEQRKREEELTAAKRAKEAAEYKLRDEADRAHQAETATTSKATEISQLRLKLSNLESTLTQTSDKLKKEEKEKDRIQDALDSALSSSSDGAAKQVRDQQARVKQLEEQLKRAEEEKERLRQGSSSSTDAWGSNEPLSRGERNRLMAMQNEVQSLRDENAKLKAGSSSKTPNTSSFFGDAAASPAKTRGKRRSLSVSAVNEVRELEGQIQTLKEQLVQLKRDLDKSVNEKLAVEITGKKKTQRMEEDMDEMRNEIDYYKSCSDGGGDKKEMEKLKKTAQAEREVLSRKLQEAEVEVEKKQKEISQLQERTGEIEMLQSELEIERQLRQKLQDALSANDTSPSEDFIEKIASLEAELAKARTAPTVGGSKASDGELRQVRRELQKALRDKEYLDSLVKENDELLAEKDDEINRLRTAIPIPGSPTLGSTPVNEGLITALEEEKASLEREIEEQAATFRAELQSIERGLEEATKQLEKVKVSEKEAASELEKQKGSNEILATQNTSLSTDLQTALNNLSDREEQMSQLNVQIGQLTVDLASATTAAVNGQSEVSSIAQRLELATASLADKDRILDDVLVRRDELERSLATRSHEDAEYDAMALSLRDADYRAQEAESKAQSVLHDLEESLRAARSDKELTTAQVSTLQAQLADAEAMAQKAKKAAKDAADDKDIAINAMSEQLVDLKTEFSAIQLQLDDKIAELATSTTSLEEVQNRFEQAIQTNNELQARLTLLEEAQADRSTESEARGKDEQLFQIQEEKRSLEAELVIAKEEFKKEFSSTTFKAEQDLLEAQRKVLQLEERVAVLQISLQSATSTGATGYHNEKEICRLEEKIARLRSERDDLRHSLSFVQNERRFAIRAAESERENALEEVKAAKEELKVKSRGLEKIQKEIEGLREELLAAANSKESSMAIEKTAELETELGKVNEEVVKDKEKITQLEVELKGAESRYFRLQDEMSNLVHLFGVRGKLSDPPSNATGPSDSLEEVDGRPADLPIPSNQGQGGRPSFGHTRSRSSVSASMLQNHTMERNLQARIQRREATIQTLTNDLEKAKANLALIQDAQEETLAENADLIQERDRLLAQVDAQSVPGQGGEFNIESMRTFVLALAIHRQHSQATLKQWHVTREALRSSEDDMKNLRTESITISKQRDEANQEREKLEAERSTLDAQIFELRRGEASAGFELQQAQGTITDLKTRLAAAEAAQLDVADRAVELASLQAVVQEKEDALVELHARIEKLNSQIQSIQNSAEGERDEEVVRLSTKVEELEKQVEQDKERFVNLQAEKEGLIEEIQAAEKALADGMADADSQREELEKKKRELITEVERLNDKLRGKTETLNEMERKMVEIKEEKECTIREQTVSAEENSKIITGLKEEIEQLGQSIKITEVEKVNVQGEVEQLRADLSNAEERTSLLIEEIKEGKERLDIVAFNAAEASGRLQQLENQLREKEEMVVELEKKVEVARLAQNEIECKLEETQRLSSELTRTNAQLASTTERLDATLKLSEIKTAQVDLLRNENENLKQQLDELLSKPSAVMATASAPENLTAVAVAAAVEVDAEMVSELKERIEQLEAALTQKNSEVDEADDQTREAFKANAKLQKKIGKLQRQIEGLQVDVNTARNKLATLPSAPTPTAKTAMLPPPVPTTTTTTVATSSQVQVASTTTQRTPLQSVNIFKPSPSSLTKAISSPITASSHKRHRDRDEVDETPNVEAIMLPTPTGASNGARPSPASIGRRPLGAKTSFTPQRNAFAPTPVKETTVPTLELKETSKNIFARPTTTDLGIEKKSHFPLPPTRNVFQPRS